jgi:PAS domain S-box-containing protein
VAFARRWATVSGLLGLVLAGGFLAAWFSEVPELVQFAGRVVETNACVCLFLLGLALLVLATGDRPWRRGASVVLALAAGAVGLASIAQAALGLNLDVDQLLAPAALPVEGPSFSNRMSPAEAVVFTQLAAALLLLPCRRRSLALLGQALALVATVIGAVALIGHLYREPALYRTAVIRLSPFIAFSALAMALGAMALRPRIGAAAFISGPRTGSYLARRLLGPVLILPVLLGWLTLELERRHAVSHIAGAVITALATIVVLLTVLHGVVRSLDVLDARRRASEEEIARGSELLSALALAQTVDDVGRQTLDVGLPAHGAESGAIFEKAPDGAALRLVANSRSATDVPTFFGTLSMDEPSPATDAIRRREPVFLSSSEELRQMYPSARFDRRADGAWAALPLEVGDRVIGVIVLGYDRSQDFSTEVRARLRRLARQCGQALDRALLFDSERAAREEARAAAAGLQAASDRLRATLDAAAIGTYTWDAQTGVAQHDFGVQTIFGFDGAEQPDLEAYQARVHPDDRSSWEETVAASLSEGTDFELRYRLLLPDGSIRWVLDKGRVSRDEGGNPALLTGAIVDLTSEHEAREAAENASRAKDEFLAMLGHELRNPLSPIMTSLELMRQRAPNSLTREREVVERQVRHMVRLVDDLLEVSRIARGRIELRRRPIELAEVIASAIEIVSPLLEERHHHLVSDGPPRGLVVNGDPARLTQVLANILSNAAKYTDPGGRVQISAERSGGHAVVRVSDSGVGIAPELLPVVFDLFVQGSRTIDRSQGGIGLGLSIVKSLVALHGGSVAASSDGVGQGSEFVVTLPLVAADTRVVRATGTIPPPRAPAREPRCILVVDDNQDAAELIAEALTAAGHQVRTAFDGPAALAISQEFDPDVVFLDIGLPVMDGYEVARRMRALEGKRMTLVAVTGYGQEADRKRAMAAGFDSHLVKPVPIDVTLAIASSADKPS